MAYLIAHGVKPDLISARGLGEAEPVASNATAQGRAQNRRVEVTLAGSGT
jgi:outer membrane protein OmpA-like peptidoglycan-associated protein